MTSSILVLTPSHLCDPTLAIAAVRAGEIGLLDLGVGRSDQERTQAIRRLARFADGRPTWGVRWDTLGEPALPDSLERVGGERLPYLLIAGLDGDHHPLDEIRKILKRGRKLAENVLLEIYDPKAALAAAKLRCDGLVLKALEAGGRVGDTSSFIILQKLYDRLDVPYWVQGAWGPDTAAAAYLAGAAGVVLGEELWLARESPIPHVERSQMARLDGSETECLGPAGTRIRLSKQMQREALGELQSEIDTGAAWPGMLYERWQDPERRGSAPRSMGQGIAFAERLARRYVTVGSILQAYRDTIENHLNRVGPQRALEVSSPLAKAVGTRYPVFQGPMTRVSDLAPFCKSVALNGGLPFLALALMRGREVAELLEQTRESLGDAPWGVGILGFVPQELRKEQLEAVEACRPRFAIIAGGRPSQAKALEDGGTSTYLHVPSPGLLENFLQQDSRKFIFEGRECGGHVGPRSSFTLWQSAIDVLLDADLKDPEDVHVLFAGGIHDGLSAAMVQTLAAPLVERGMKIGVLMGTAYLFTHEAVACGAITATYQDQAMACNETALLHSGVGHATRCARTPFAEEFEELYRTLLAEGRSSEEIRFQLEMLNVGRLRMASKGLRRVPSSGAPDTSTDDLRDATEKRMGKEDAWASQAAELLKEGAKALSGGLSKVDEETQRREGMYMIGEVATMRGRTLSMASLHENVCIGGSRIAERLSVRELPWQERIEVKDEPREPIAVIGMDCKFPESPDLRSYWQNILNGFDAVREVSPERWRADLFYSENRLERDKLYSKWGSFLDDVRFDPLRYKIPPAAVASIDPVQLMLLDVAQGALEDAGYGNDRPFPRERTAVIIGSGGVNDMGINYAIRTMLPHYLSLIGAAENETQLEMVEELRDKLPEWTEDSFPGVLINVLSGRVANRLDLQGPNFVIDAACASSLAALYTAMEQLRSGSCDMALAGAADGTNSAFAFMSFSKTHALTPSGKIRPFDDRADGIVLGEGVGAVVLKRLSDAERDGDRIYTVIRGAGSSSDGRSRSLTAPHPAGQVLAFERAYADARIDPSTVTLVEAHATGTTVGDQSEIEAMKQVFGGTKIARPYCAVGSVKSNIGHAKTAAGIAAFIKTALALQHKVQPPTINVEVPNQRADLENSPFWINTGTRPWIDGKEAHPRRAGVSAFGFGGTNFHLVLEEYRGEYYEGMSPNLTPRSSEIFLWQRKDHAALAECLKRTRQQATRLSTSCLADLASCVHHEESAQPPTPGVRLGIVAGNIEDLLAKLDKAIETTTRRESLEHNSGVYLSDATPADPQQVCFLFPGQGAQRPDMLKDLVQYGPFGLELIENADRLLADLLPRPLSSYIFPLPTFDKTSRKRVQEELNDTRIAQPALGVMNQFASDVLQRFGLRPTFTAGHSYGEYVALSEAGLTSRQELLMLSALRGRAVHEAGRDHPGGMAAVAGTAEDTQAALDELGIDAIIANFNAPRQMVIAGSLGAIETALKQFPERNLAIRRVPVTAAFHSPAMEEPARTFAEHLKSVPMALPRTEVFSNVDAKPYPRDLNAIRAQLATHLARPVRFVQQIRAMHDAGARIFIEAGPGRILTSLVPRILGDLPHTAVSIDMPGQPGWTPLGHLLARTHTLGLKIDLAAWFENRGLENRPVAEFAEQAVRREQGRPTDWIINPRGARRVNDPPSVLPTPQKKAAVTAAPSKPSSPPPAAATVKQGRISTTMTEKPKPTTPAPSRDAATTTLLSQLQETMAHWLELQRDQQRLNERFLQIQERIVGGLLGGHPDSTEALSSMLSDAPPTPAENSAAPAGLSVTPAPVLPNLQPTAIPSAETPVNAGLTVVPTATGGTPAKVSPVAQVQDESILVSVETFTKDLLNEVSQRTGYPQEMLELDLPLEAGLGVDSIKTMEIFSALKPYHKILQEEDQDEEDLLVGLAQLKTLQDIIDQYSRRREEFVAGRSTLPEPTAEGEDATDPAAEPDAPVERLVLRSIPAPSSLDAETAGTLEFPRDQILLVVGEAPELASSMEAALATTGYRAIQIVHGQGMTKKSAQRYEVDLLDVNQVRKFADAIQPADGARVGGLVNLLALGETLRQPGLSSTDTPLHLLQALTHVAQVFEDDIRACGKSGGGYLINVTTLDGRFGLRGTHALPVAQAGSLGFFKSLSREWREVRVKNVDLDPNTDPKTLVVGLLQELATRDELMEVGLDAEGRWRLTLVKESATDRAKQLPLDRDAVVLATGGAYGITAEAVKSLAERTRARLVIVGRTPIDTIECEPEELRAIRKIGPLRTKLIERMRAERTNVHPADIEKELQRLLKHRAIRANLESMREAGSEVEYHAIDVRDADAFGNLIDDLYARFGRIDGVLHGAGVIEDRWLKEKTADSVARVFETKVNGALLLAKKLRPEGLKFFVLYSSISGRFGNVGQIDYSAANEVLNKLAAHLNREWPGRVVAVNWGPWDSGMVSDGLRSAYAERGIRLIPIEAGVRSLMQELALDGAAEPEVVLTCSAEQIAQLGEPQIL